MSNGSRRFNATKCLISKGWSVLEVPWRWGHYIASKRWDPITGWHSTISQKSGILWCMAAKLELAGKYKVWWAHRATRKVAPLLPVKAYRENRGVAPLILNLHTYCLLGRFIFVTPQCGAKLISVHIKWRVNWVYCVSLALFSTDLYLVNSNSSRSRWLRDLRRRSAASRLLGSCVRIPLRELIFVSCLGCVLRR